MVGHLWKKKGCDLSNFIFEGEEGVEKLILLKNIVFFLLPKFSAGFKNIRSCYIIYRYNYYHNLRGLYETARRKDAKDLQKRMGIKN
jgi:hypothetical protein